VAQALNATKIVFHGGVNPLVLHEYYRENWLQKHSEFWQQILNEYNGIILLENIWEPDPSLFRNLLDRVGSPRLKLCLDVAHANVYSKVPLKQWLTTWDKDLVYMHFSDNHGEADRHLEVGAGKIDWQTLTADLKELGLEPEVVLEEATLEKTQTSIAYIREHGVYPF